MRPIFGGQTILQTHDRCLLWAEHTVQYCIECPHHLKINVLFLGGQDLCQLGFSAAILLVRCTVEAHRLLLDLAHALGNPHILGRHTQFLVDFVIRDFPPQFLLHLCSGLFILGAGGNAALRNMQLIRARIDLPPHRTLHPPGRVGAEAGPHFGVELLDGPVQAQKAGLDQIRSVMSVLVPAPRKVVGHREHQRHVQLDDGGPGRLPLLEQPLVLLHRLPPAVLQPLRGGGLSVQLNLQFLHLA
mmetsp:Transcript_107287/g.181285  ORF Transcript_107287/g.181285 Transcript_107287/m.181285 type:complete len:244 (-) Transcript_107287:686-1417(-)